VLLHAIASSQAEVKSTWSAARRLFNIAHSSWVLPFMQLLFHCPDHAAGPECACFTSWSEGWWSWWTS